MKPMSRTMKSVVARSIRAASGMPPEQGRALLAHLVSVLERPEPVAGPLDDYLARARVTLRRARVTDFEVVADALFYAIKLPDATIGAMLGVLLTELPGMLPRGRTAGVGAWERVLGGALAIGFLSDQELKAKDAPLAFEQALRTARRRGILPTDLSSADLRKLEAEILRGSIFSARTTDARYLQAIKRTVERMLEGLDNLAGVRALLGDLLIELGYDPETGFPGDVVEPAERGSLRDLSSEARINLVMETQVRMMTGAGYRIAGQEPERLYQFPAWELIRISDRETPRGTRRGPGGELRDVEGDSWPERWEAVGGTIFEGDRMIALKDDPIWNEIGSRTTFDDGLGNPYPPFAYHSGYGVREIGRDECLRLGVMEPSNRAAALPVSLERHFQEEAKNFDDDMLAELERELEAELGIEPGGSLDLEQERRIQKESDKASADYLARAAAEEAAR